MIAPSRLRYFERIMTGLPVGDVLAELAAQPELWAVNPDRLGSGSPHEESQDIWLRWQPPSQFSDAWMKPLPHNSVFWPAWDCLPSLHTLVFDVMRAVQATQLGGILGTRLPPGGEIRPHIDQGWHPSFYTTKAYLILQANDRCVNFAEDERVVMRSGEAWIFDNQVTHSVRNDGGTDRIAIVSCMRCE